MKTEKENYQSKDGRIQVKVFEYSSLKGGTDINAAQHMYFMQKQGMKVRVVEIEIRDSSFQIEPGAMSYFNGNLKVDSGVTMGNVVGKIFQSAVTKEAVARPRYTGTGKLVLEPTFRHIIVIPLDNESIIVDKGMFYGAEGNVEVKPVMQDSVSAAILGNEGLFQIELKGTGIVILESIVPVEELVQEEVRGELKVDGNFAVMRSGNLKFTVEQVGKGVVGSMMTGEGLVNTFKGEGIVWLAPTLKVYQALEMGHRNIKNMDMNTRNTRV